MPRAKGTVVGTEVPKEKKGHRKLSFSVVVGDGVNTESDPATLVRALLDGVSNGDCVNDRVSFFGRFAIPSTDGSETFASSKAVGQRDGVFSRGLYAQPSVPTAAGDVDVYDLAEDSTVAEGFEAFGVGLDRLALTQGQVAAFVRDHMNGPDKAVDHKILFVVQAGGECAVAQIIRGPEGWSVLHRRFDDQMVCPAAHLYRVAIPRLTVVDVSLTVR